MNDTQRQQIEKLRAEGLSYGKISDALGLSTNTIKTYCRRHGLGGVVATPAPIDEAGHFCLCCGIPVVQTSGRKKRDSVLIVAEISGGTAISTKCREKPIMNISALAVKSRLQPMAIRTESIVPMSAT